MKKYLPLIAGTFIFLVTISYFTLDYAVTSILPFMPIRPPRVTRERILKKYHDLIDPSSIGLKYSDFNITVEDSIKLKGWFIYSQSEPAQGTIFLLHGIASCRNSMLPLAKILATEGFNCVCYDSRHNDESGGLYCTYGYYEKRDLSRYIDSALIRFPNSGPYGVFGNSLGAAIAVQAMSEDKRIVCGIAESTFADLRNNMRDYFARIFFLKVNFITDKILRNTEQIAHFQIDNVQPVISAKKITQPIMIIHGLKDEIISPAYGQKVYDNLSSKEKFWYPIPKGNHYNLSGIGGSLYHQRLINFFKKYLVEQIQDRKTKSLKNIYSVR